MLTSFTQLVGCRVPIQQAPMGAITPPAVARAVAAAGGVGTISVPPGGGLPEGLPALVGGGGVYAVNFVGEDVDREAVAQAARSVRLVDFFWSGPRRDLVEAAQGEGALVNWQVGSLDEARRAVHAGADLVTVQGREAGGHVRGNTELRPLLAAAVAELPVPVLAAGGIADARGFAELLAAGASGARVGTPFIASEESGAHPEYVDAVLRAGPSSTTVTDGFAVCPLCATQASARVLTSCLEAVAAVDGDVVGVLAAGGTEMPLPPRHGMPPSRAVRGQIGAMALYAGESVDRVTEVRPAARVVADLLGGRDTPAPASSAPAASG